MSDLNNDLYDICIIGAGPTGYSAAIRGWDFQKKVCLVSDSPLGGAGVEKGALSSKTLWELAKDYQNAKKTDRGYRADNIQVDFTRVAECVGSAISEKLDQMELQLEKLKSPTRKNKGSITYLQGTGRFLDENTLEVTNKLKSEVKIIRAKNFLIATGSKPRSLPDINTDGEKIVNSDHILLNRKFPKSLVILGAGVIGCEFATIFSLFGQTKVYLIDRQPRILPFEDEDVAWLCSNNLEAKGVTIHHSCKLLSMKANQDGVNYTIEHPHGGHETISVEQALISVGRVPNVENLGLENTSVKLTETGHVKHKDGQTDSPNIYAAGDVTLDVALVSVGEIEGRNAIERICGINSRPISYQNISTIMFLDPEVAAIGMNEITAQQERIPYKVAVYGYKLVNRAIAMRSTDGFVKLLVTDDEKMQMLGMRALGVHASTTIEAASLMIALEKPVSVLAELFHPHPAITEGLQECVRMLTGSSIYKPEVFGSDLRVSSVNYS